MPIAGGKKYSAKYESTKLSYIPVNNYKRNQENNLIHPIKKQNLVINLTKEVKSLYNAKVKEAEERN